MQLLAALAALVCLCTPVCRAEACGGFKHIENGRTFFRHGGLLVTFRCHPGYKLHGYKTNSCVSGHWSRDPPVCVGSGCSSPGPLTNGTSSVNANGSWVAFSCDGGFQLHGPSMLYCKGHTWNSTKPVCKEYDMMSSVSGVSVQKPDFQDLQDTIVMKMEHNTFSHTVSEDANPRVGLLSHVSPQVSNNIRVKVSKNLPQHLGFPGFIKKDGLQTTREAQLQQANEPTESWTFTWSFSNPRSTEYSMTKQPPHVTTEPPLLTLVPSRRPACPYPPVPVHGTVYFRRTENPTPEEHRHYVQYACYPGYTLAHGDIHRYCLQGTWSGVTPVCLDVDECLLPIAVTGCLFGCVNTPGSFYCQCPAGYSLQSPDGRCQDIDECAANQGLGPCMDHCHNLPGSYRCSCVYGRTLSGDGHSCTPECRPGFRKQPALLLENSTTQALREACVDVNECQEHICDGQCVNLPGSHRCICPRGYTLQADGRRCKDINECSQRNGGCSHLCVNQNGAYKCACPPTHRLSSYSWKKCVLRTLVNAG